MHYLAFLSLNQPISFHIFALMKSKEHEIVILFDGFCGLCNSTVDWLIKKDHNSILRYSPLQGKLAKDIGCHIENISHPDSIIIFLNGKLFDKSTAALLIAKKLPFPWKLLYAFIIIPAGFRNLIYDFIASNRYKWFGKSKTCRVPSPKEKNLFID